MDARVTSAFTRVFDALLPAHDEPKTMPWNSMSRRHCRQFFRFGRSLIATPDHVHVRPQQQEIISIDIARPLVGDVEALQRRTDSSERALQRTGIGLRPTQPQ